MSWVVIAAPRTDDLGRHFEHQAVLLENGAFGNVKAVAAGHAAYGHPRLFTTKRDATLTKRAHGRGYSVRKWSEFSADTNKGESK